MLLYIVFIVYELVHNLLSPFVFHTTPPEATQGSTEDVLVLFERQAMPYQVYLNLIPSLLHSYHKGVQANLGGDKNEIRLINSRGLFFSFRFPRFLRGNESLMRETGLTWQTRLRFAKNFVSTRHVGALEGLGEGVNFCNGHNHA